MFKKSTRPTLTCNMITFQHPLHCIIILGLSMLKMRRLVFHAMPFIKSGYHVQIMVHATYKEVTAYIIRTF